MNPVIKKITRRYLPLVALFTMGLLLAESGYALATHIATEIQWSKTYGPFGACAVIQTQDGGIAIAGSNATRLKVGYGNYTPILIKTNNLGDVELTKNYREVGAAISLAQTEKSEYVLLGYNWLLKTDDQGNLQWNRTVSLSQSMGLTQANDSYIVVGYAENQTSGYNYATVLKYSENGGLIWQKMFSENQIDIAASTILQTHGGNEIIFAGSWNQSFWFVKLDGNGNTVWSHTYGYKEASGISPLTFHSVDQTQDGGYILAGTDGKYAWLVKTDNEGKEQWHQRYNYASFVSIAQEKSGKYLALSNSEVIGIDNYGGELWNESFNNAENAGSSNPDSTSILAASGIVSNDGGLVVVGSVNYRVNNTYVAWAAKFALESNHTTDNQSSTVYTLLVATTVIIVAVAMGILFYKKVKNNANERNYCKNS